MWRILLLLSAAIVGPVVLAEDPEPELLELKLTLDLSRSRAHEGDNLTAVCRVTDMPDGGFIYWFKTVMGPDQQEHIDLMALSNSPILPYDNMPRYSFTDTRANDITIYTMNIHNVKVEDTGHIGCSYREVENNRYEVETFEVYKHVDDITFKVHDKEIGIDGVSATEGDIFNVTIDAGESIPAPIMKVYLVDTDGEKTDKTDDFVYSTHLTVQCGEGGVAKDCALHYTERGIMKAYNLELAGDVNKNKLLIEAAVPGSEFTPFEKDYTIFVTYMPIYKCLTFWSARKGSSFTIQCTARADPKPYISWWTFTIGNKDYYLNPHDPEANQGQYIVTSKPSEENDSELIVSLTIMNVYEKNYGEYNLHVGNDVGNSTNVLTLTEDTSPTGGTSDASIISMSSTASLLGALFVILFKFV